MWMDTTTIVARDGGWTRLGLRHYSAPNSYNVFDAHCMTSLRKEKWCKSDP